MKKLLLLSLLMPLTASASNTITFLGEVSDSTCNVTVNGNSGDLSIQLPTVTTSELNASGATAGEKEFSFEVSGCSGETQTTVGLRLLSTVTDASGNLSNIASTNAATEVTIQILDGLTNINFSSGEYHSAKKAFAAALTFPFTARYFATGASTAGAVEAKMEYALSYS